MTIRRRGVGRGTEHVSKRKGHHVVEHDGIASNRAPVVAVAVRHRTTRRPAIRGFARLREALLELHLSEAVVRVHAQEVAKVGVGEAIGAVPGERRDGETRNRRGALSGRGGAGGQIVVVVVDRLRKRLCLLVVRPEELGFTLEDLELVIAREEAPLEVRRRLRRGYNESDSRIFNCRAYACK